MKSSQLNEQFLSFCNRATCIEDIAVVCFGLIYDRMTDKTDRLSTKRSNKEQEIITFVKTYTELFKIDEFSANKYLKNEVLPLIKEQPIDEIDLYWLIKTVDRYYDYQCISNNGSFSTFKKYSSLSKIVDDPLFVLLPRQKNTYISFFDEVLKKNDNISHRGLRKKEPYDHSHINAELENFILLNQKDLMHKINIIEFNEGNGEVYGFLERIRKKHTIKCVTIPLTNESYDKIFDLKKDSTYFWIDGIKANIQPKILKEYMHVIDYYKDKDIDFIIFPELFLSSEIQNKLSDYLINSDEERNFQIYILGSKWEHFSNKAVLMTSEGEIVCEQYKNSPFELDGLTEKLDKGDNNIYVLDFQNCFRMNTFICKDIIDGNMISFVKRLESELLFAPSYSRSLNMKAEIEALAKNRHCTTIMSNSCSARYKPNSIENNDAIGFVCQPKKNEKDEGDNKTNEYRICEECKACNYNCLGHLITIDFGRIEPGEKTFKTIIQKME